MKQIKSVETLENIHGEAAKLTEYADGTAEIITDTGQRITCNTAGQAVKKLYKAGYRF